MLRRAVHHRYIRDHAVDPHGEQHAHLRRRVRAGGQGRDGPALSSSCVVAPVEAIAHAGVNRVLRDVVVDPPVEAIVLVGDHAVGDVRNREGSKHEALGLLREQLQRQVIRKVAGASDAEKSFRNVVILL